MSLNYAWTSPRHTKQRMLDWLIDWLIVYFRKHAAKYGKLWNKEGSQGNNQIGSLRY